MDRILPFLFFIFLLSCSTRTNKPDNYQSKIDALNEEIIKKEKDLFKIEEQQEKSDPKLESSTKKLLEDQIKKLKKELTDEISKNTDLKSKLDKLTLEVEKPIDRSIWDKFKLKVRKEDIIFDREIYKDLENYSPLYQKIALIVSYEEFSKRLNYCPKKIRDLVLNAIYSAKLDMNQRFIILKNISFESYTADVYVYLIKSIDLSNSRKIINDLSEDLSTIFQQLLSEEIKQVILPPILKTPPLLEYQSLQDLIYKNLVLSIITFIANNPNKLKFVLYDWIELNQYANQLIYSIHATDYYIGVEEQLDKLNCWRNYRESIFNLNYLDFDSLTFSENYYAYWHEWENFDHYSEKHAREHIVNFKNHSAYFQGKLAEGYGKFVLKENGCVYWRQFGENIPYITHAFLTKGKRILAGGWIQFHQGKITCLNRSTGHYRTDEEHLQYFIGYLKNRDVMTSNTRILGIEHCELGNYTH